MKSLTKQKPKAFWVNFLNICDFSLVKLDVTLPETNIAMENPQFWWYLPGKMVDFPWLC